MTDRDRPKVLTDAQWEVLAPLIEACRPPHKTEHHDLRRTIEAIIWRHDSGAKWRQIPAARVAATIFDLGCSLAFWGAIAGGHAAKAGRRMVGLSFTEPIVLCHAAGALVIPTRFEMDTPSRRQGHILPAVRQSRRVSVFRRVGIRP